MTHNDSARLRWGILGTGWISTAFATDLLLKRPDVPCEHIIAAVGTSSAEKGEAFVNKALRLQTGRPSIYTTYGSVYADPNVDIVYVGTPHALHKQNCLDAIAAGKHVLCEKPLTINASEAEEVISAAKAKGVFFMEAVWTRFFPLMKRVQELIHTEKAIGEVTRVFCDFGMDLKIDNLPSDSRLKDPSKGAGALLDIGIYSLMYGLLTLDSRIAEDAEAPVVNSALSLKEGIDRIGVVVLVYPSSGRMGILSSSTYAKTPERFCRIEGTQGTIEIAGPAASWPRQVIITRHGEDETIEPFEHEGMGFFFEADAVAADILAGRKQNSIMPPAESLRVMQMMDQVRKQAGHKYPQDD